MSSARNTFNPQAINVVPGIEPDLGDDVYSMYDSDCKSDILELKPKESAHNVVHKMANEAIEQFSIKSMTSNSAEFIASKNARGRRASFADSVAYATSSSGSSLYTLVDDVMTKNELGLDGDVGHPAETLIETVVEREIVGLTLMLDALLLTGTAKAALGSDCCAGDKSHEVHHLVDVQKEEQAIFNCQDWDVKSSAAENEGSFDVDEVGKYKEEHISLVWADRWMYVNNLAVEITEEVPVWAHNEVDPDDQEEDIGEIVSSIHPSNDTASNHSQDLFLIELYHEELEEALRQLDRDVLYEYLERKDELFDGEGWAKVGDCETEHNGAHRKWWKMWRC